MATTPAQAAAAAIPTTLATNPTQPAAAAEPPKTRTMDEQIALRLQGLAAGGFAGAVAKTTTAPFDRVKILCQTGRSPTPTAAVKEVWSSQGIQGFWKGNAVSVLRIIPNRGVLFMTSDFIKDMMQGFKQYGPNDPPPALNGFQYVCAGAISGGTTVLVTYPLDFIRGRMTGHMSHFSSISQTLKYTVENEGWRQLYRGMSVSLLGAFPYEGIRFGVYDILKSRYIEPDSPIFYNVLIGAIAGLCATSALYPNDTVRRRLQVQQKQHAGTEYYHSGLDAYKRLYQTGGLRIFYRGVTANLARAGPSAALQFGSFEFIKKALADRNQAKFGSKSAPSKATV